MPGSLSVAESGSISLEVFDVRDYPSSDVTPQSLLWYGKSEPRVVGFVEQHGRVVISQCSPVRYSTSDAMISSFSSVSYAARSLLTVKGGDIRNDSVAKWIGVDVEGLARWIGKTGYSLIGTGGEEAESIASPVGFESLDDIEFDLGDGVKGSFVFRGMSPGLAVIANPLDVRLKQDVFIGLSRESGWHVEEATELVVKWRNLFALLTDEPVEVLSVSSEWFTHTGDESADRLPIGNIYYESMPYHQAIPDDVAVRTVLRYEEVADHLEQMLQDWFTLYDRASQALDIYFVFRYSETISVIETFLALTRAIESFHRQTTGILEAPFRSRLSAIMSSYQGVFPHEGKREDFVLAVRDARNYWTHFEPGISDAAGKSAPLWWLLQRLDKVLQMCILDSILPSHLSAAELISRSPFLSQNLDLWSDELSRARGYIS